MKKDKIFHKQNGALTYSTHVRKVQNIQFVKKIFAQKEKMNSLFKNSTNKIFLFLHTFYNYTCLRPEGTNSFLKATHITIIITIKEV